MTYKERILKTYGNYIETEKNGNYSISDERKSNCGIWIYLKDECISKSTGCSCIHEDTWRECWKALKMGFKKQLSFYNYLERQENEHFIYPPDFVSFIIIYITTKF